MSHTSFVLRFAVLALLAPASSSESDSTDARSESPSDGVAGERGSRPESGVVRATPACGSPDASAVPRTPASISALLSPCAPKSMSTSLTSLPTPPRPPLSSEPSALAAGAGAPWLRGRMRRARASASCMLSYSPVWRWMSASLAW
jgi:hypothetical protein